MHIVSYDISDTSERNRLVRIVEQFGMRVERSVWLCDLGGGRKARFLARLRDIELKTGFIDIWRVSSDGERIGSGNPMPRRPPCHVI